jgi:phage shock protein A
MGIYTKKKKGRGRPSRVESLERQAQEAILQGDEMIVAHYLNAIQGMVDLMTDKDATHATRQQAFKFIIERGNKILEEMMQEEEDSETPALNESIPLISKVAIQR